MNTPIDWHLLSQAQKFYEARGYKYVDVPWVVSAQTAAMTFHEEGITCQLGSLVGSGEQGFLASSFSIGQKYMTITPCFRDELHLSDATRSYFMKLELFREYDTDDDYSDFMTDALVYLYEIGVEAKIIETADGHDIELNGLELGSYGKREVGSRKWVYGTGLALPRVSIACQQSAP